MCAAHGTRGQRAGAARAAQGIAPGEEMAEGAAAAPERDPHVELPRLESELLEEEEVVPVGRDAALDCGGKGRCVLLVRRRCKRRRRERRMVCEGRAPWSLRSRPSATSHVVATPPGWGSSSQTSTCWRELGRADVCDGTNIHSTVFVDDLGSWRGVETKGACAPRSAQGTSRVTRLPPYLGRTSEHGLLWCIHDMLHQAAVFSLSGTEKLPFV